jgi:hypothetical protein
VDPVLLGLDAVTTLLALLLAGIAIASARRYEERRFAFVGLALLGVALVGALGCADILSPGSVPGGEVGYPIGSLLLLAELLLYLSMVSSRSGDGRPGDG